MVSIGECEMNKDGLQILLNDKLLKKASHMGLEERDTLMKQMCEYHNKHSLNEDVMVAIEEMSELTQVLSKIKREKIDKKDIWLSEEIADVRLCMYEVAKFVFDLPMDVLQENTAERVKKDMQKGTNDVAVTAMGRMGKLSHKFSLIINREKHFSNKSLIKSISKVNASMLELINEYDIDFEVVKYIEDIKMDRTRERLKNGTN